MDFIFQKRHLSVEIILQQVFNLFARFEILLNFLLKVDDQEFNESFPKSLSKAFDVY